MPRKSTGNVRKHAKRAAARKGVEPREGVEDVPTFPTAREFMQALSPTHELWHDDPTAWIYRGHGNAAWFLRARALRPGEFAKYRIPGDASHWKQRSPMLTAMLRRFRQGLDASGIVIPAPSPTFDGDELAIQVVGEPPEHFPLMALAQHHGLPTSLLDWTRLARNAAYFAAAAAADRETKDRGDHLAVCALRGGHDSKPHDGFLQFYKAPGGTNPNLRAQSGLFTLLFPTGGDSEICVEAYVAIAPLAPKVDGMGPVPVLRRLTLPSAEAGRLLRLLSYEGVDGASMFPGADGVVRAMRERAFWDQE